MHIILIFDDEWSNDSNEYIIVYSATDYRTHNNNNDVWSKVASSRMTAAVLLKTTNRR